MEISPQARKVLTLLGENEDFITMSQARRYPDGVNELLNGSMITPTERHGNNGYKLTGLKSPYKIK